MSNIVRATSEHAEKMFEIMVQGTAIGCGPAYPPEVIEVWHQGRTAEGTAGVIAHAQVYTLVDDGEPRGFVHFDDKEVIGLFVDPDHYRRGYGSALFRFAVAQIETRPIKVLATLNARPFYEKLGCRKVATELVRRHDHDIYVDRMELP